MPTRWSHTGERVRLLDGGESGTGRTRSTLPANLLLPVVLAVLAAKSSFLALERDAVAQRVGLLQGHGRSATGKLGRQQRLIKQAGTSSRLQSAARGMAGGMLAGADARRRFKATRLTALDEAKEEQPEEDPDEAVLRSQMGRGWTHRGDAHVGSNVGGPGVPLTGSYAMTPEDLQHQQFEKVIRQRQFDDMVVDGRTGMPIDLTDEQKRLLKRHQLEDEAMEQEDVDAMSDPFRDAHVPSQFIYPDGESIIPHDFTLNKGALVDKHVMANGTITEHQGPLGGIFREGVFGSVGKAKATPFNKIGESFGFGDRPLAIRDVDYEKLRKERIKGLRMREREHEAFRLARINGTEHKFYCSGKECDDQWGIVGDQVVDLRTGKVVHEGVGPGDHMSPDQEYWIMDRHFDPHTGLELNHCVGPQCSGYHMDMPGVGIEDKYGDATTGTGNFGDAIPADQTQNPQQIREHQRAGDAGDGAWDSQNPNDLTYEPYAQDPRMKARYDLYTKESRYQLGGSWSKKWNAGSWVGFMVLGPVLTAGVCTFVFMTRGVLWGSVVLSGLVLFDVLMYYFG